MQNKDILISLRSRLLADRFIHSLNVADTAEELAKIYGFDARRAYLAGLVHDCTKNTPPEKQLKIIEGAGIKLTPLEMKNKKLWHAISGSVFIQNEYDIHDEQIISAVRYHTTGKADMSLLQKIIYTADFTSAERSYEGVEKLRRLSKTNLDKAVYEGALFTVESLSARGADVHPDTIAAMNFYNEEK